MTFNLAPSDHLSVAASAVGGYSSWRVADAAAHSAVDFAANLSLAGIIREEFDVAIAISSGFGAEESAVGIRTGASSLAVEVIGIARGGVEVGAASAAGIVKECDTPAVGIALTGLKRTGKGGRGEERKESKDVGKLHLDMNFAEENVRENLRNGGIVWLMCLDKSVPNGSYIQHGACLE